MAEQQEAKETMNLDAGKVSEQSTSTPPNNAGSLAPPKSAAPELPKQLPQPNAQGWRFWLVFIPLCVSTLLAALESTVTSTALPTIVRELDTGENYIWILNGYLLTSTALLPIYGQFAQVFGRRYPAIVAVAMFTLGSGISGGATSTTMLIAGRVVQGIGGGSIGIMTQLIISDLVSLRDRGKYMGLIFGTFGLGATLGPVVGGLIVQHVSWRWVFYINLPVGGLTLLLQILFLQVTYTKRLTFKASLEKIDWIGNGLLVASVVSVLIALSWADIRYSWSSWHIIVPLVLGFAGTAMFHAFETTKYARIPTIPPRAFGNRTTSTALALTFIQNMLTYWRIYFLPVYFQSVRLNSAQKSGLLLLPTVGTGVPVAIVAGLVLTKFGRYKPLHLFGFSVMTIAAGLYILFDSSSSLATVIIFQIIAGIGTGCTITTMLPAVQAPLPQSDVAIATSTWGFIRSYASIWGVSVPAAIFNSVFARNLGMITDPAARAYLSAGGGYSHISPEFIKSLPEETRRQAVEVYTKSLKVVWEVALALSVLGFLLVFLEKEVKLRTTVKSDYQLKLKTKTTDLEKPANATTDEAVKS